MVNHRANKFEQTGWCERSITIAPEIRPYRYSRPYEKPLVSLIQAGYETLLLIGKLAEFSHPLESKNLDNFHSARRL